MAITKRRTAPEEQAQAFIEGAPDGMKRAIKTLGKKSIITLSIDPDVLARLDAWAKSRGLSRAAAVSLAVSSLE
jgi:hypothetical protein